MEKQKLKDANTALILGISSIVTACCCYAFPGIILGYIGMQKSKKAKETYNANPELYSGQGNIEAGRITSMIGLILGVLFSLYFVYMISTGQFGEMMEQYKQMIEQAQGS